jgi:hypothetical protein
MIIRRSRAPWLREGPSEAIPWGLGGFPPRTPDCDNHSKEYNVSEGFERSEQGGLWGDAPLETPDFQPSERSDQVKVRNMPSMPRFM